ncbi:unnamed protein product [marine sediment metagenome]|uniref:Uncharacterized protein n=1 Tax=marine sediment metagenome TaxID=412755 RepID=X1B866_9ZZZZ
MLISAYLYRNTDNNITKKQEIYITVLIITHKDLKKQNLNSYKVS